MPTPKEILSSLFDGGVPEAPAAGPGRDAYGKFTKNHNQVAGDAAGDESGIFDLKPPCPACGCVCGGIEPMFPLRTACEIIPFPNRRALVEWLRNHPAEFPPRIRKYGHTKHRMLTSREILRIREILMQPYSPGRPPGHPAMQLLREAARKHRKGSLVARFNQELAEKDRVAAPPAQQPPAVPNTGNDETTDESTR